jgi:CHAT domain-containing protein
MRRSDVRYAELVRPKPVDVQQVQREILDSKTVLLEYRLMDKEGYLFAVTAEDFNVYPLPDRETVNKVASDLYESLTARSKKVDFEPADERERRLRSEDDKFNAGAPKLSRMILGQVTRLYDKKRVLIVADGLLQYFPFAALPVPNGDSAPEARYLVNKHEIVYLPSASALRLIRAGQSRPRPKKQLAVIADPIYQPSSAAATTNEPAGDTGVSGLSLADAPEPLKYARQEAESILSMVKANDRAEFLDERATKQAATADDLVRYRFIHYGVHGTFDSEHPTRSGLIFSMFDRKGTPIKGGKILTLAEVYNLKLSADLVTLSSCQTALGQEIRGEGIIGLTRGFMYAGTRRVLASLWIVNDEATALLMQRFYSHLLPKGKRLPPAEALKAAQESMIEYHPFYWAGFTLQGEW